jgi:hypothetical protein
VSRGTQEGSDRGRPWVPRSLSRLKDPSALSYVVVDEMDERIVRLTVSPWPVTDAYGRLRFYLRGETLQVGVPRRALQEFLGRNRRPPRIATRPVRIGDVFAFKVKSEVSDEGFYRPEDWIGRPAYDISADAREAAKASFYAAVTPTLESKVDAEIIAMAEEKKSSPTRS